MRRALALAAASVLCLSASVAAAAETVKGTIKKVDDKSATITFAREGADKEEVLAVDESVDLKKLKANTKAQVTLDGGVVKGIKPEAKARAPGY